jgi:hypothetical protein
LIVELNNRIGKLLTSAQAKNNREKPLTVKTKLCNLLGTTAAPVACFLKFTPLQFSAARAWRVLATLSLSQHKSHLFAWRHHTNGTKRRRRLFVYAIL